MSLTTREYCRTKTLIIPQSLDGLEDARCLLRHKDNSIFYRLIRQDMKAVEFYTDRHCIVYVLNGTERFTAFDHSTVTLQSGELLFIPKSQYLISDFKSDQGPLEALLIFFSDSVLTSWVDPQHMNEPLPPETNSLFKLKASRPITAYMSSLKETFTILGNISGLLDYKLAELLYLIDNIAEKDQFRRFLDGTRSDFPKRNILHVLEENKSAKISVEQLALLSGRSLSSFQRDFKRQFGKTPGQWIQRQKLEHAYNLVINTSMKITDIAFESGYESLSHFIRLFSRQYGETPKQARKRIPMI